MASSSRIRKKRKEFTHEENLVFLDVWREFFPYLEGSRKTGRYHMEMVNKMAEKGATNLTKKNIAMKIDNMQRKYKSEMENGKGSNWLYFDKISQFYNPKSKRRRMPVALEISPDQGSYSEENEVGDVCFDDEICEEDSFSDDNLKNEPSFEFEIGDEPEFKKFKEQDWLVEGNQDWMKGTLKTQDEVIKLIEGHSEEMHRQTKVQQQFCSVLEKSLSERNLKMTELLKGQKQEMVKQTALLEKLCTNIAKLVDR